MKRNRQHIIENESENILRSLIPTEWVLRKLSPDYGIDFNVEIFEGEEATGIHFFLQLKGTDKIAENDNISFQLEKKYIDYYQKIALPVLFVFVSVKSKKVWAKWLNRCAINEKNKTRTLKFTNNDILTKDKINNIKDSISVKNSSIRIKYIDCDNNLKSLLNRWILHLFKESVVNDKSKIADEIVINFKGVSPGRILLNISDERFLFEQQVELSNNIKDDLLHFPEIDRLPNSFNEFFYEFSKILLVRNCDSAIYTLLKILPELKVNEFSSIISVVSKCISKNLYSEIEQLGIASIKKANFNLFQLISLTFLKHPTNNKLKKINENLLLGAIRNSDDKRLAGMFHYNLANHYQNTNNRRKAIKHYLKARKKEPDYLNRGYWYRELAGMLFLEKHYSISANLYAKSLEDERQAKDPINKALAADAYFMARQFEKSLKWFEEYVSEVECPETEFVLKKQVIKSIKDEFDLSNKFSPKQASKKFKLLSSQNGNMSHEKIHECLVYDPISPEVRYQEGLCFQKEGKFDHACISFLVSALVAEWNVAAWLNSFFMALEIRSHLMDKVLYVAYKKCGYSLIEVLREELLKYERIPLELRTQVLDAMRDQFETYRNKEIDNKANSADAKNRAAD